MGESKRRDKPVGICWHCGKLLVDGVGKPVIGVALDVGGNTVRSHKVCAASDQRRVENEARDANLRLTLEKAAHRGGRFA
jgi:hypothetical protein